MTHVSHDTAAYSITQPRSDSPSPSQTQPTGGGNLGVVLEFCLPQDLQQILVALFQALFCGIHTNFDTFEVDGDITLSPCYS